jgi:RIO-like serine/threonine protein kinase
VSRRLLGGFLLRREGRVLAMLRGVAGVPNLVATTPTSLVVDWLPGDTLFQRRKTGMSPETATRLVALLADLHARGFAHGDIGRRDVLVAPDGSVSLVDFATAVGPGAPPLLWRVLAPWWRRRDAARLAKLIRRYRRRWDARVARGAGTKA